MITRERGAGGTAPATGDGTRIPDVPAGAFRRHVRHQPVDGPDTPDRRRPRDAAVGPAPAGLPRPRPRRADDRAGGRAARHGVRRQRRHRGRREGARRAVPLPAAGRGGRRVPGLVPRPRLRRRAEARARQRGRGRHPVHRAGAAGRLRLPQRPGRRGRAGRAVRAAGGEPAPGRPALLPPGHGAVRARRRHRHVLPGRVRRRRAGRDRRAVRRADRGEGRGRRGARAERGQRRPARRPAGPGQRLAAQLSERGFEPVGVDMSELLKGGGGPKCCTLELR